MFIEVLSLMTFALLTVSGHQYSWYPPCDRDLTRLARADIFKSDITDAIRANFTKCRDTIDEWMDPIPCPNSCNEIACSFQCAVSFNSVSILIITNSNSITHF